MTIQATTLMDFDYDLHEFLIEKAKGLRPLLAMHAQTHEDSGEILPEVIEALEQAGLFRMSVPRRWGGLSIPSVTMANVAEELAKGCPSSAWVVSIVNSTAWVASTMAPSMQELIFGEGVPRICGPSNGMGRITERNGRYYVVGRWAYGSASHHAKWALVPAMDSADEVNMTLIPMSAVQIENTWKVTGMRGTGSDTVLADDVEITSDQFCKMTPAPTGVSAHAAYPKEASDFWVAFPLLRAKALGVLLGTVAGLLESVIETKDKPIIYSAYKHRQDSELWRAGIGRAAAELGVARAIVEKHSRISDHSAAKGHTLTYEERATNRGECAVAADMLISNVERLMDLTGSSGFATKERSQRYWRDFSIGIRHVIFNSNIGYEVLGRQILGIEPNVVSPEQV